MTTKEGEGGRMGRRGEGRKEGKGGQLYKLKKKEDRN